MSLCGSQGRPTVRMLGITASLARRRRRRRSAVVGRDLGDIWNDSTRFAAKSQRSARWRLKWRSRTAEGGGAMPAVHPDRIQAAKTRISEWLSNLRLAGDGLPAPTKMELL